VDFLDAWRHKLVKKEIYRMGGKKKYVGVCRYIGRISEAGFGMIKLYGIELPI